MRSCLSEFDRRRQAHRLCPPQDGRPLVVNAQTRSFRCARRGFLISSSLSLGAARTQFLCASGRGGTRQSRCEARRQTVWGWWKNRGRTRRRGAVIRAERLGWIVVIGTLATGRRNLRLAAVLFDIDPARARLGCGSLYRAGRRRRTRRAATGDPRRTEEHRRHPHPRRHVPATQLAHDVTPLAQLTWSCSGTAGLTLSKAVSEIDAGARRQEGRRASGMKRLADLANCC
jgi:hypothetical protein